MTAVPFAWVTHAPADYMLVFTDDPDGEHAAVRARFEGEQRLREAGRGLGRCRALGDRAAGLLHPAGRGRGRPR
jgi:hypothetical protein